MDTIFALASAPGKAGVAVIRLSGPVAHEAASKLAGMILPGRGMTLRMLHDANGQRLDQALLLTFVAPDSFTGENIVEFQVHGSIAVVSSIIQALSEMEGLRLAEPGEFTRRALENGKLDLAQVEGLADLIDAETEAQRRQAQNVLAGDLGRLVDRWRTDLIRAASLIEATIDFADEDVPIDVTPEVTELLSSIQTDLIRETAGVKIAERIRVGFEVAIIGAPNVGKSTLLNALAGRQAAITSEHAGTTRDVIEVRMDLGGLPVTLLDTAGLRHTTDEVEGLGIALARRRGEAADLRVFLLEEADETPTMYQDGDIVVLSKADQRSEKVGAVSGVTGEGLDQLIGDITSFLTAKTASIGLATRERHRLAMNTALDALTAAKNILKRGPESYDLVSEELRTGIRALESLVGRIDVETLLDEIFSSFCIGK